MAAPKVTEVLQKVSDKVIVYFDQPLDDSVQFEHTNFSINYGRIPISSAGYYGTAGILITLDRQMTYRDKLEINYQPPTDLALALRAPVAVSASDLIIKRNAVRAFYKVPVKNMMVADENAWMANSNWVVAKRLSLTGTTLTLMATSLVLIFVVMDLSSLATQTISLTKTTIQLSHQTAQSHHSAP